MRLLAAARLCGVGQAQEFRQRAQPGVEVEWRCRAGGEHRVEHLRRDLEAGVAFQVVGAQALEHVVVDLGGSILRRCANG